MLAFVHIEKTAGVTINWILRRSFGLRHCDVRVWQKGSDFFSADDFRRTRKLYHKVDSIAGHSVKPYSDLWKACPNVQYYTFLREPISRCASHYQYQIQVMGKRIPFEDWIKEERFRNFQAKKLSGTDDRYLSLQALENLFFVGLKEQFDESIVLLRKCAENYDLDILYRIRNVSARNIIKKNLMNDPSSLKLLVEANKVDIEIYDYACREIYVKQKKQYGKTLEEDVADFQKVNFDYMINCKFIASYLKRRLLYLPSIYCYNRFNIFKRIVDNSISIS